MRKSYLRTYGLLGAMLAAIVLGCLFGAFWPGAVCLEPLGTIFINLMFCIVVPLVFCSLAGSVANMHSPKRAGKIMGVTLAVFVITGLIAGALMLLVVRIYPPVLTAWTDAAAGTVDDPTPLSTLIVNFFTVGDFASLLSRKAMLPLIVFSLLFGFGVNLSGGPETLTAKWLSDMTNCLLKVVSLISYYAPIAFFGFFASLVATYGAQITASYGRAMIAYYPLCLAYALIAFPLYARFGGGTQGVRVMREHIFRPAVTALGTCSSVATIPTNLEAAQDSGVPHDVADLVIPLGATMHMDVLQLRAEGLLSLRCVRNSLFRPRNVCQGPACGGFQLRRHVRYPRRRLYRRVHHLLAVLPRPYGDRLSHRRNDRQSCGPSRHHDQLRRRLCGDLHRLALRGREKLAQPAKDWKK